MDQFDGNGKKRAVCLLSLCALLTKVACLRRTRGLGPRCAHSLAWVNIPQYATRARLVRDSYFAEFNRPDLRET